MAACCWLSSLARCTRLCLPSSAFSALTASLNTQKVNNSAFQWLYVRMGTEAPIMLPNGVGFSFLFSVRKVVNDINLPFDAFMYGANRSALLA